MADVIFQKRTCLKSELFDTIVSILKGAGWENVASNPATEYAVMKSTGESGDKNLVFQLRPISNSNVNDTTTTDFNVMSIRLIAGYTPGVLGVDGVPARTISAEPWRTFYIAPTTTAINRENELALWFSVNKDRLILIIETPSSLAFAPITHYIGLPDVFSSEPDSRGLIWASSAYNVSGSMVLVTDAVGELPSNTASSTRSSYVTLPPSSPNSAGSHTPVIMFYGNATEGWRGRLDGLHFLPVNAVANGDTLTVGTKTFRGVVNGVAGANSFVTSTLLFQIK